jgi:broad specificity phosphatase PhoE
MNVYLLRHGETDWNAAKRLQGHEDVPLNETGRLQARQWRQYFDRIRLDGIYSSPLTRTMETAVLATGRPACVLPDLRERHMGEWQGRSWSDLCDQIPDFVKNWRKSAPPGGESFMDVARRVRPLLAQILDSHSNAAELLIVTHGGVGKIIHAILAGIEDEEAAAVTTMGNGAVTLFRKYEAGWELMGFMTPSEESVDTPM